MPKNQPVNAEKNQPTATSSAAEKEKGEVKKFSPPTTTDAKELRDMKLNRLIGSMSE